MEQMSAARSSSSLIVHLVCARPEEAFAIRQIFATASKTSWDLPQIHGLISYQSLNLDPLKIYLTFPIEQGSDFALSHIKDCLQLFQPDLSIMTGICAGPRGKVNFGDVIVATRAFNYERGKRSDAGHQVQPILFASDGLDAWIPWIQASMSTRLWHSYIVKESPLFPITSAGFLKRAVYEYQNGLDQSIWLWAHGFDRSKGLIENKNRIPNYDKEMAMLVAVGDVQLQNLELRVSNAVYNHIQESVSYYGPFWGEKEPPLPEQHGPRRWRQPYGSIDSTDVVATPVGSYFSKNGVLATLDGFYFSKNRLYSYPHVHYGIYASGSSVRSDTVIRKYRPWGHPAIEVEEKKSQGFEEAKEQYRDTLAMDMEGAAFYQALQGTGIKAVCIKGVSDYGDHTKDDQIHQYAKEAAASYAWELIQVYYEDIIKRSTNKAMIADFVGRDGQLLRYTNLETRNDKVIVLAAVRHNGLALQYANPGPQNDKEVVLAAVRQNGLALQYASEELKNDTNIVLHAVENNDQSLEYLSPHMINNKQILLTAVRHNSRHLRLADSQLQNDRELVLIAVTDCGLTLEYASPELQNDKTVVVMAVSNHGLALQYASPELRNDEELVTKAIKSNAGALKYASLALRGNKKIVLAAVGKNGYTLEYACEKLKSDTDIVLSAVRKAGCALRFAISKLQDEKEIVAIAVRQNGLALQYTCEELQNDKDIVLSAVQQSGEALQFASEKLRNEKEIVLTAVRQNGLALEYGSPKMRSEKEIVSTAWRQNPQALRYVQHNSPLNPRL